jgi:glutamine---fructose-6-phosphate transaminase (isomerizing)
LIVGIGKEEVIIASDIQAIVAHTNKVMYVEDQEVVYVDGTKVEVFDLAGKKIKKEIVTVEWSREKAEKLGYAHFMLKEIFEQPRAVAAALEPFLKPGTDTLDFSSLKFGEQPAQDYLKNIDRIYLIACGTSYYAGMVGEYLIEKLSKVAVEVELASEFRYREPVLTKNSLVVVISQSGETADTLAALRLAKKQGSKVLSICNVVKSTIDRESDAHIYMRSGVEVGVASTKAFTSTMGLLNAFAMYLAKVRGILKPDQERECVRNLLDLPSQMEHVLAYDKFFKEAASSLKNAKGFLYMARGASYPIALEGALKLKELAYMHAEGYAAGEMKHGPIALIDERMVVVVVCPKDDVFDKTVSNLEEVRARGGQIISIGSGPDEKLEKISKHYLGLPVSKWNLNPILAVIPLQLLAYHVADALGHDVDQPRNLAKSVTVE